jgi:hypothetical protein
MVVYLVGQAPSRTSDPSRPLAGRPCAFLGSLVGLDADAFRRRFRCLNLLQAFPGKAGKGDAFPIAPARSAAAQVRGRRLLLLGRNVARAFGHADAPLLRWERRGGRLVAVLPHPSGINVWWNEPRNRRAARRFLRETLEEVVCG